MTAMPALFVLAALTSLALGGFAVARPARGQRSWSFGAGMVAFALESVAALVLVTWTETPEDRLLWLRAVQIAGLLLLVPWAVFTARLAYPERLRSSRPFRLALGSVTTMLIAGAACVAYLPSFEVADVTGPFYAARVVGWGGLAVILQLFVTVALLSGLEAALRAASRDVRWRLKYLVLGLGGVLLVRFYLLSQIVLFNVLTASFVVAGTGTLLIGNMAIAVSLARARLGVELTISRQALYGSLTVGVLGVYLLAVGVLGWFLNRLGIGDELFLGSVVVFVSALGLSAVLLSDSVRWRVKRFVARNFYRSKYDYRTEWSNFTKRLASLVTIEELAPQIVGAVAETVGSRTGILYLKDSRDGRYHGADAVGGSRTIEPLDEDHALVVSLSTRRTPLLLDDRDSSRLLPPTMIREFPGGAVVVPLRWRTELVGLLLLGPERTGTAYDVEDLEFLETIAEQAAGVVATAHLAEDLARSRAFEAFHRVTSFVIHDLKNSISSLSMLSQNALRHYDDPEFQRDAIRTLAQTVERMKGLLGRMSASSDSTALNIQPVDLAGLVLDAIVPLVHDNRITVVKELASVPPLPGDAEALRRVVQNLVTNAVQSIDGSGTITVKTHEDSHHAVLVVSDTGCGMSEAFIRRSLFSPFSTTKKEGWGIGLYQSKSIVEAHGGTIEVSSAEGKGTTFCVRLPV